MIGPVYRIIHLQGFAWVSMFIFLCPLGHLRLRWLSRKRLKTGVVNTDWDEWLLYFFVSTIRSRLLNTAHIQQRLIGHLKGLIRRWYLPPALNTNIANPDRRRAQERGRSAVHIQHLTDWKRKHINRIAETGSLIFDKGFRGISMSRFEGQTSHCMCEMLSKLGRQRRTIVKTGPPPVTSTYIQVACRLKKKIEPPNYFAAGEKNTLQHLPD